MLILTPNNVPFEMDTVGELIPETQYGVLDVSDMRNADYYFHEILSTVNFSAMAAEIEIGTYTTQVPLNWQILLGDEDTGMMEMASIEDLLSMQDRKEDIPTPYAFVYNQISSMYARFLPVRVKSIVPLNMRWQIPMLQKQNLLAIPLEYKEKPMCAYFADENERIPDFMLV